MTLGIIFLISQLVAASAAAGASSAPPSVAACMRQGDCDNKPHAFLQSFDAKNR